MNTLFKNIIADKLQIVKVITSIFFIAGITLSPNLWITNRNFPILPVFDQITILTNSIDSLLYFLLILLLIAIILSKKKIYSVLLFVLLGYLLLQDQMRWQPWVYIYILTLFPFVTSKKVGKSTLRYLQILFIGIYFWSGVHKLNPNFNELIVESFTVHLFKITNSNLIAAIKQIGFVFAFIEIITALLLFIPKTRKMGVYLAIITHLFIILYISPIGMNYNYIILPWNVFMILIVSSIFYNSNHSILIINKKEKGTLLAVFALLIISLPVLNFKGKWDSYLSFSLYSGKINNYYILLKDDEVQNNHKHYLTLSNDIDGGGILDINAWAMNELNVPMIPEDRAFKQIARSFCKKNNHNSVFITTKLPLWKLMYFDFYKGNKLNRKKENTVSELFFLNFKKPLKKDTIQSFNCNDMLLYD